VKRTCRSFALVFSLAAFLIAAFFATATPLWSQDVTASITGTVTDPSGAAVAGATVTATEVSRGTVYTTKSNDTGLYNLLRIPIGTYNIRAESKGFENAVQSGITLVLNQIARMDFQLKVGAATETVEVTSAPPVLQTQTTQLSTVVDSTTIENLPLASGNYIQLTLLAPGSVQPNPASMVQAARIDSAGRPYINGNREQSDNFLLDGVDNNEVSDNLVGYQPQKDAIQEFNLITQNAPAEFGSYAGGIINATIKSGSNSFHGDAFEYFRNDKLNANSWQNNLVGAPKNGMRWNLFGGTFGGPIKKDKLFFFADYQGQRFDFPSSAFTPAPKTFTAAERAGNFGDICTGGFTGGICNDRDSKGNIIDQLYSPYAVDGSGNRLPYANNIITDPINPVAQALFASSIYPAATSANPADSVYNYDTASAINVDQGDARVDYNISNSDRLFFRYSREFQDNPNTATGSGTLWGLNDGHAKMQNGVLNWTHVFSPTLVNEARMGVNYVRLDTNNSDTTPLGSLGQQLGIPNANDPGPGLPYLNFSGFATGVGGEGVVQLFATTVLQYEDNLTINHGRHTFHVGFQFFRDRINAYYSGNNGQLGFLDFSGKFTEGINTASNDLQTGVGAGSGYGGADFYLGLSNDEGRGSVGGTWGQRANVVAGYLQDDWQVTPNLTLNLGLRYENHTPWVETHDRMLNFGFYSGVPEFPAGSTIPAGFTVPAGSLAPVTGSNRALYNTYNGIGNYQPRIGIAWTPGFLNGKTVVRAAFTSSSYLEGTGTNLRLTLNPPFGNEFEAIYTGTAFQSPGTLPPTVDNGLQTPPPSDPFAGAVARLWAPDIQPELNNEYNLTVQERLNNTTTLQVGYVGQRTTHLMVPSNYNQKQVTTGGCSVAATNCVENNGVFYLLSDGPIMGGNPILKDDLGPISGTASSGNMDYNALQAVLQKQYGSGLQYQVSYTYSKCMTNSSGYYGSWGGQTVPTSPYFQNIYDPRAEWGACYYDVTHDLTANAVYDIPVGKDRAYGKNLNPIVRNIVGDWTISPIVTLRGGFPLTFEYYDFLGTGTRGERPDCNGPIPIVNSHTTISGVPGIQWFNPSNASAPAGVFGTCGIGTVRGPGEKEVDMSLIKDFHITESKRLEFRSDFINLFNHPVLTTGYCTIGIGAAGCGTDGVINTSQLERNIQFALKFIF
jgi:Carboxypeptidase regulatory-like domain